LPAKTFMKNILDVHGEKLGGAPDFRLQTSSVPGVTAWLRLDRTRTTALYGDDVVDSLDDKIGKELERLRNTDLGIVHARALESADIAYFASKCILP
jgi:hypothetical protein